MTETARHIQTIHGQPVVIVAARLHPEARPPYHQPRTDGTHLHPVGHAPRKHSEFIRGPGGRGLCRWCWAEVPKGRLTWCSSTCLEEYRINHDWNHIRWFVEKRDHGVCSRCGLDTAWLKNLHACLRGPWRDRGQHDHWRILGRLLSGNRDTCRDWWEADHIQARADGGPDHPSNLRTLCIPCHRAHTRHQAGTRAESRRAANASLFVPTRRSA